MISLNNLANNPNMTAIANKGVFTVFEHQKDMSVSPAYASVAYFMHEMNVRKRQVLCNLNNSAVRIQAGAMQWAAGQVESETGVKGVGDFIGKAFKGAVTNESAVKPIYRGSGFLMLEPTYRYIILEDIGAWTMVSSLPVTQVWMKRSYPEPTLPLLSLAERDFLISH